MCPPSFHIHDYFDPNALRLLHDVVHRSNGFGTGASPGGRVVYINYLVRAKLARRDDYFRSGKPRWRLTPCGLRVGRYLRDRRDLADPTLVDAVYDSDPCPLEVSTENEPRQDPDELYRGYHDYEDWDLTH